MATSVGAVTVRRAVTTWEGPLNTGSGVTSAGSSGTFSDLPVSWPSRTEQPDGRTSPEELLAAAHASCFAMAFASRLAKTGAPPQRLEVAAEVSFEQGEAGWRVASSRITVRGRVEGIEADRYRELAEDAKENCPISQALRGNVEMSVEAALEE